MNKLRLLTPILLIAMLLLSCTNKTDSRLTLNFNTDWQFYKSVDTAAMPSIQAEWETVILPHTANIEPLTVNNQWQGICYYKKDFTLDRQWKNKTLALQFDAAMNVAEVWVNGQKMTTHLGGYLPFVINLDGIARFDTINSVLVRLDNRDNPITGPKPLAILDFNMYGGLYRNVHLLVKNKVSISNPLQTNLIAGGGVFFATTKVEGEQASVEVKTHIENKTTKPVVITVKQQLTDPEGKTDFYLHSASVTVEPQNSVEIKQNGTMQNARLWSPDAPNLYQLKTEVFADGQLTDSQTDRVGIRSIEIKPEGLWLNGKKTFLRGVNRHQEYPYIGYASSDAAQYRDAYKIKQAGFDYVRCSHYPMSPAFLDACDELGIMVLDAILGWQYFGNNEFEKLALRSSHELIRRDRNHPCVLAWELSINETWMPKTFTDSAQQIAHLEYPYPGCYSAGWMRNVYDIYIEARQHRHGLYPEQPLLVSEYGDWEYFAQNAGFNQQDWKDLMEVERNSRQPRFAGEKRMLQQALNIQEAHNDNLSTHAFADGYWVMFDYNRGMAPDQEYSGIMDIFRLPKFSYYFLQSQRSYSPTNSFSIPVLFIASYWQPGVSKQVRIFSNAQEVELFVDEVSCGRQKPDINNLATHLSHPPFTFNVACKNPGTLKALAYIDGKIIDEQTVQTSESADHLALQIDESGKPAEKNDVLFVYARIEDLNNTPVESDSSAVTFTIEGAQIIGPATVKAQGGIATAVIHTQNKASQIIVKANSNSLKGDIKYLQIN